VFRHLNEQGFAAHAVDYRGHGQADGRRGHVDHFGDYLDDVALFLARVREKSAGLPLFVLSHSHGALIFAELQLREPTPVQGVVYSSPWIRLAYRPSPVKVAAARVVGRIVPWMPFDNELKPEQLSHDPEHQAATARDPLYNRTTTPRWFFEAHAAQAHVLAHASQLIAPSLVLVGESDPIADPPTGRAFFERLGAPDKTLRTYETGLHELMNESEPLRGRVLADVSTWIHARCDAVRAAER
jgi:alpha-beta hydrolase superfamily lysophospholipase